MPIVQNGPLKVSYCSREGDASWECDEWIEIGTAQNVYFIESPFRFYDTYAPAPRFIDEDGLKPSAYTDTSD